MKKLLTGIMVLALANMAFAVPAFTVTGDVDFDVMKPATMTQTLSLVIDPATSGIGGLTLYLETVGNMKIDDIVIDTGTAFAGNTTGAVIVTNKTDSSVPTSLGLGSVTTVSGTVTAGTVALITVTASGNVGDVVGLTTGGQTLGNSDILAASGDGLGATQLNASWTLVPEPVSALLLLAGLPLIRRRRA